MRFHISLTLAAALAVASITPVSAGNLVAGEVESGADVAAAPVGSMGGLGGGVGLGVLAILALAVAAGGGSSSTTTTGTPPPPGT